MMNKNKILRKAGSHMAVSNLPFLGKRKSIQMKKNSEMLANSLVGEELAKCIRSEIKRKELRVKIELAQEELIKNKEEVQLDSITKKYNKVWKKLQSFSIMIGLLRIQMKKSRTFGIYAKIHQDLSPDLKPRKSLKTSSLASKAIIKSTSAFYRYHVFILTLITILALIFFPLDIAFEYTVENPAYQVIPFSIMGYLALDIIINFFTLHIPITIDTRQKDNCMSIEHMNNIGKRYLETYFLLDVLSTIPMDLIFRNIFLRISIVFKMPSLLNSLNSAFGRKIENKKRSQRMTYYLETIQAVFHYTIGFVFFIHLTSCLWISIQMKLNQKTQILAQ